jgi:hypothetical protein
MLPPFLVCEVVEPAISLIELLPPNPALEDPVDK